MTPRAVERARAAFALAISASCACSGPPAAQPPSGPPPLRLEEETAWPPELLTDPLWRQAAQGAALDLARLALRVEPEQLLVAVDHGGNLGRTALGALRWSEARYSVRGALCERLHRCHGPCTVRLLRSVHDVLQNARRSVEDVDADQDAQCAGAIQAVLARSALAPGAADLAHSALSVLAPLPDGAGSAPEGP